MNVEDLVGAIRAEGGEDPELAAVTQLRLRRSLETRARGRHQLAGILTAIAILFAGTVSWALATGRVTALWAPAAAPRKVSVEVAPPPTPAPHHRVPSQAVVTAPRPALPPETVTPPPPSPVARPPITAPPVAAPVPPPRPAHPLPSAAPPVEQLYRRAHKLHFHGGDPATSLAAWDAYLAAEPGGRFSVEARYNRAIILVRLGRYAEARAALAPFARGDAEAAGYRQTEAGQLVERRARYE